MNFCWADHQQVLESPKKGIRTPVVESLHCGGCVKTTSDDEHLEFMASFDGLSVIKSSEDEGEETDKDRSDTTPNLTPASEPVTAALDSIQRTLEDFGSDKTSSNLIVTSLGAPSEKTTPPPGHSDAREASSWKPISANTASPSLLNPLTTEWDDALVEDDNENPRLLCPILDSSSSFARLMQRLEKGFRVRLTGGPIACMAGDDNVYLYLHEDRSRLCVESDLAKNRNEKKNEVGFWIEVPLQDILRLEVGGKNKNAKAFSVVLEKEIGCLVYYNFEATSVIDREVVVSAIMLLLDQIHNSEQQDENVDCRGGTMDQPIPCSPSLDLPLSFNNNSMDQPIPCSPSLENDSLRELQLSPSKRTQIYSCPDDRETETSLVIRLEDVSLEESGIFKGGSNWCRRELPTPNLQQKSNEVDDIRLDFKPSASSTQIGLCQASSMQVATGAWCSTDVCSLALNDIADTCTGIFAMKHADNTVGVPIGCDQGVLVEEFIASALGAPTAVYTYVTEGDIWNVEKPPSAPAPNDTSTPRNRASLLNAQAARLRSLRNEMTFAAALKQSRERMHFVQTVRSFDDAYNRSGGTQKLSAATAAANQLHSSPLLRSVVERMKMHDVNGDTVEEETAYYDSDPEDSRSCMARQGSRQLVADRLNKMVEGKGIGHKPALSGVGFEDIRSSSKISRKLDEETIVEIVTAMVNEKLTLMWHPTQSKSEPNRSPVCVKVWIEAGVYLNDGTFLLPKLAWSKASQDNPLKQHSQENLDLLDICRICPTTTIDRRLHPFALASKSFFVETQTEIFVFQAQTIEERDRIVYGLKLVVARLASMLMLRDIRAAEEFFGAPASMVPGEAPAWVQGKDNESTE